MVKVESGEKRNYGIDLLRIVSMFMVVMLHILPLEVGKILSIKKEVVYFLECACFCAVNCYALISGYVGVRKNKRSYSNIIYLWFQVVFISLMAYLALIIIDPTQFRWANLLKVFFPVLMQEYWYFSAYFLLFLVMPVLNYIVTTLPKKKLQILFVTTFPLISILNVIKHVEVFGILNGYSFLWLAILYMLGAYIYLYNPFKNSTSKSCFRNYWISIILLFLTRIVIGLLSKRFVGLERYVNIFLDYPSVFVLLSSIFLLAGFSKLNIKPNKIIPKISSLTFGIYLIHLTDVFRIYILDHLYYVYSYNIFVLVLLIMLFAIIVYLISLAIDYIRLNIFNVLRIKQLSQAIDRRYVLVVDKICNIFNKNDTESDSNNNIEPELNKDDVDAQ